MPRKRACYPILAALALAACQQGSKNDDTASPRAAAKADAAQPVAATPASALSDGRLVLPVVKGGPGAAYFTYRNSGRSGATIVFVAVDGAEKAEMHRTDGSRMTPIARMPVASGETVTFEPGGKHIMVFGVPAGAKPGDSIQMTVTLADGVKRSAPLKVEAAGGMEQAH